MFVRVLNERGNERPAIRLKGGVSVMASLRFSLLKTASPFLALIAFTVPVCIPTFVALFAFQVALA
jgi:hypothetical protein